ncbi:MAG: hypothetical protein H3C31_00855 [Brumimicrobium sp.]|nr:hypothetical protein [Brumimicrobium sp.]
MSKEELDIDRLFSDAAHAEKAPQYDTAYWKEMKAVLDEKDAKRRGLIYWSIAGTLVVILLISGIFLRKNNLASTPVTTLPTQSNESLQKSSSTSTNILVDKEPTTEQTTTIDDTQQTRVAKSASSTGKDMHSTNLIHGSTTSSVMEVPVNESSSATTPAITKEVRTEQQVSTTLDVSLPYTPISALSNQAIAEIIPSQAKEIPAAKYLVFARLSGGVMENYKSKRAFKSGILDFSVQTEMKIKSLNLKFGIGTQYINHSDLILSKRETIMELGVPVTKQHDLSYQNFWDLYIPVEFGYRIKSSSFGVGLQANYLMSTNMTLNQYKNHTLMSTEKFSGRTDGLKRFSMQGYVWFEQRFTPRLSAGLRIGTNIAGRININEMGYFNESSTTNPMYGQFYLRFDFLK